MIINNIEDLPSFTLPHRAKDLSGKIQGKLTFLKPAEKINKKIYWWAQCECGEIEKLRSDATKTCCLKCANKNKSIKMLGRGMTDLTNQKFNKLTALYLIKNNEKNKYYWHCKCDCGNECDVLSTALTSGNTKSCGCLKKENCFFAKNSKNLIGQKFGFLTVLEPTDERQYSKIVWKCQCDCGKIVYLNTSRLTSHNDISCGCKKQSTGAKNIKTLLNNYNIDYFMEFTFSNFPNRRYDFALFNSNNKIIRLIEFDGEQHYRSSGGWNTYESLVKNQKHDKEKNEYALSHNIPLVRIPYWERDNITLEMLLGDKYLVK